MVNKNIRNFIEAHEKGFSDNPKDPGGFTNHGVSFRFLRLLHPSVADIDGDGDIDVDDILHLTENQAWGLFVDYIFIPSGIYLIQGKLSWALMDTAVNMGPGKAVKLLQGIANEAGARCRVDGIVGPETVSAVAPLPTKHVIPEYLISRMVAYKTIVARNPKMRWAYDGWINRVLDLKEFLDNV